jgi:hypothetical protein
MPFDEDAWDAEPDRVNGLLPVRFPAELNQLQDNRVNIRASMFRVTRYAERPEDFPEAEPDIYFYGRVIEQPLDNLRGWSGGPILALGHPDAEGEATYHLVAMQVSTLGNYIKGMLMQTVGEQIEEHKYLEQFSFLGLTPIPS